MVGSDPLIFLVPFGSRSTKDTVDNEIYSMMIYSMFKNKTRNGIIIQHPLFDCQWIDAPLVEEFPLTFSETHKIIGI